MIIDNDFLNKKEQEEIYNVISSVDVPWYLFKKTSQQTENNYSILKDDKTKENHQFSHILRGDNEIFSYLYDYVHNNVFIKFLEKHNIKCNRVLRAKLNFVSSAQEDGYQSPHVDVTYPHKVFLYYVNDSDGDTIMFNEKYDGTNKSLTIMDKVSPEMGKAILFDGLTYHSPSTPKKFPYRIVINIAFIEEEKNV
jgi:hypothetical protein